MKHIPFISAQFSQKFIRCVQGAFLRPAGGMSWGDVFDPSRILESYVMKFYHNRTGTWVEVIYNGQSKRRQLDNDLWAGTAWGELLKKYLPRGREVLSFGLAIAGNGMGCNSTFGTVAFSHEVVMDGETMRKGVMKPQTASRMCLEIRRMFSPSAR